MFCGLLIAGAGYTCALLLELTWLTTAWSALALISGYRSPTSASWQQQPAELVGTLSSGTWTITSRQWQWPWRGVPHWATYEPQIMIIVTSSYWCSAGFMHHQKGSWHHHSSSIGISFITPPPQIFLSSYDYVEVTSLPPQAKLHGPGFLSLVVGDLCCQAWKVLYTSLTSCLLRTSSERKQKKNLNL